MDDTPVENGIMRLTLLMVLLVNASLVAADTKPQTAGPVAMYVETTLPTDVPKIRQYAFDGNYETYFSSSNLATSKDSFTLTLNKAVRMKSVQVITGLPGGQDILTEGIVEISGNGK